MRFNLRLMLALTLYMAVIAALFGWWTRIPEPYTNDYMEGFGCWILGWHWFIWGGISLLFFATEELGRQ